MLQNFEIAFELNINLTLQGNTSQQQHRWTLPEAVAAKTSPETCRAD